MELSLFGCFAILALGQIIQSWELLRTPLLWNDQGAFRSWGLGEKYFRAVLQLRIFLCLAMVCGWTFGAIPLEYVAGVLTLLWILNGLIHFKFQGGFNGGSDSMQNLTLTALTLGFLARCFTPNNLCLTIALYFIAAQGLLSYFIAGITKLKVPAWRSGQALREFTQSTIYPSSAVSGGIGQLCKNHRAMLFGSWLLMLSEVCFPVLILLKPEWTGPMLTLGIFFHLVNAYFLGINRFIYAWLATYPCILFLRSFHG